MKSLHLCFIHNRRGVKGKETAIELRVTYGRQVKYINTGIKVWPRFWNKKKEEVKGCAGADEFNLMLAQLRTEVTVKYAGMRMSGRVEVEKMAPAATRVDCSTFLEYVERRINERVAAVGTVKHWKVWLGKIREWGKIVYFSDLTVGNIMRMDEWLRKKGLMTSTVYTYHKHLRLFCNDAVADGLLDKSPYQNRRFKLDRGEKANIPYLPEEKMKALLALELDGYLDRARDMFVFQMFTGLSYVDMQRFDIKQYRLEDGRWIANSDRKKTGVMFISQLLRPAVEILEKYGYTLPKMSNQKYNVYLKGVGALIGVKGLRSHMARSTFATYMLSKGCKIQNVAKMLGHTNIRQTQRYANVLAKDVLDDFTRIDAEL